MPRPQPYPAILIAEDEYVFAAEMAAWIEDYCLNPLGPVSSVQAAKDLLDTVDRPDAAILDIQLRGENVYPIARILRTREIPFVFVTGYDRCVLPPEFRDIPLVSKPTTERQLLPVLQQMMSPDRSHRRADG
jgi:CheY-like chemotaxis protein